MYGLDRDNTIWLGDVVEGHVTVAKTLGQLGRRDDARAATARALAAAEQLAAKDPTNKDWAAQVAKLRAAR